MKLILFQISSITTLKGEKKQNKFQELNRGFDYTPTTGDERWWGGRRIGNKF
jgi:hypothetical protein